MATVEQLKQIRAKAELDAAKLQPALDAATNAEDAAYAAKMATAVPGSLFTAKIAADKALAVDPTNPDLQAAASSAASDWQAARAVAAPANAAYDAATAATAAARAPFLAAQDKAGQADLNIAKIDPTQASPEAVALVNESTKSPNPVDPVAPADAVTTAEAAAVSTTASLSPGESIVNEQPVADQSGAIDTSARNSGASVTSTTTPKNEWQEEVDRVSRSNLPKGAQPNNPVPANAQWSEAKDLRVKLRVPSEYLVGPAAGPSSIIKKNGGILFPYTPQISMQNQANYAQNTPLHSNYPLYFFKNGSIGPIQVTAKFTVQNEFEGAVLLGVLHLLRGLTKMKWGDDPDAGAPPPVCRFDAYGDYMMYNVPVAISNWRHELSDNCDYIAVGRPGSPGTYGHSMVPTMSTITLDLNVMYSRQEMLSYSVKKWQAGELRGKGYL